MPATSQRRDPLPVYCFRVEIDGIDGTTAFFRKVSGLRSESEVVDVLEGGQNGFMHRLVGQTKWANLIFERGFSQNEALLQWREEWLFGSKRRRNGRIIQLDTKLDPVCTWSFRDGWPCRWELSEFDASKSELAMEVLEIAHHGLLHEPLSRNANAPDRITNKSPTPPKAKAAGTKTTDERAVGKPHAARLTVPSQNPDTGAAETAGAGKEGIAGGIQNCLDEFGGAGAQQPVKGNQADFEGSLRGDKVTLTGVKTRRIRYTKRDPGEVAVLRREFNNTVREEFVKHLAADPDRSAKLKAAGLDDLDIQDLKDGVQPAAYQVHHKLPLDDGGTNDFSNLILIKQHPYHKVITNAQNTMIRGMRPGDMRDLDFPVPDGFIYPP